MFLKYFITFIICTLIFNKQSNILGNRLKSESKIFHKINVNSHKVINKIFNCLKLNRNVTKISRNKILINMHMYLNNIVENDLGMYDKIKDMSRTNVTGNYRNRLFVILNGVMKETTFKSHTTVFAKYIDFNKNLEHVKELISKIGKITIKDIMVPLLRETYNNLDFNIKVWEMPKAMGKQGGLTRRLYMSKRTNIKMYPFIVSVHIMEEFICAGSIVSKDLVITAASCLHIMYVNSQHREDARMVFVRVGSDYAKRSSELLPVAQVHFHPSYDALTLQNNLAVIRLGRRLKLSRPVVRRINYDRRVGSMDDDGEVIVLGWGAKDEAHDANNLQTLSMDFLHIYNLEKCRQRYSENYVTDDNFCAGFQDRGGGACNRDVGGPAVQDGKLVGVISFGPAVCGLPNSPTVFTKVGHYADWIDSIVHKESSMVSSKKHIMRMPTTSNPFTHIIRLDDTRPDVDSMEYYAEEMLMLKEILEEVVLTNKSLAKYKDINNVRVNEVLDTTPLTSNANNIQETADVNEEVTENNEIVKEISSNDERDVSDDKEIEISDTTKSPTLSGELEAVDGELAVEVMNLPVNDNVSNKNITEVELTKISQEESEESDDETNFYPSSPRFTMLHKRVTSSHRHKLGHKTSQKPVVNEEMSRDYYESTDSSSE